MFKITIISNKFMPRESGLERYLNRKIDRARVKSTLAEPSQPRTEILKPEDIPARLEKANGKFISFLAHKYFASTREESRIFEIFTEELMDTLELSGITPKISAEQLDSVVLSIPGILKTEKGYVISEPLKIAKHIGVHLQEITHPENKVLAIFQAEPEAEFSTEDIETRLHLKQSMVNVYLRTLLSRGDIVVTRILRKTTAVLRGLERGRLFQLAKKDKPN